VPPAQPIQVAPYFAYAQFGDPAAVLAMSEPPDDLPFPRAMWHYARGVALAAQGDPAAAEAEAEAIAALAQTADLSPLLGSGVPADRVMGIAREVVLARAAQARDDLDTAIGHFEAAATAEEGLPYMEPAYWYYPVRQSLGAALLEAGRAEEAEAAFRASLDRVPNSGWSCFGLMEAARAQGDETTVQEAADRLEQLWIGDRGLLDLQRL
jgi:tetratricopeptide (TPR) repeat protein